MLITRELTINKISDSDEDYKELLCTTKRLKVRLLNDGGYSGLTVDENSIVTVDRMIDCCYMIQAEELHKLPGCNKDSFRTDFEFGYCFLPQEVQVIQD